MIRVLPLFVGVIGLLVACGEEGEAIDTAFEEAKIDCSDRDPALTWDNFGESFVTRYCTSCHGAEVAADDRNDAPQSVNLDTLEDVVTLAARIELRVVDMADMPPGGGPGPEERHRMAEWLRCDVNP